MDAKAAVWAQVETVANEHHKSLAPLSDDLPLMDSGLDSLCLAVIVARLEEQFGVDPFVTSGEAAFPTTLGELTKLYVDAR